MEAGLVNLEAAAALRRDPAEQLERLAAGRGGNSPAKAADEMEALFATLLVKEMRKSLSTGFFGTERGADTFEGWFDEHVGRALATSGGLGLADSIEMSLQRKLQAQAGQEGE